MLNNFLDMLYAAEHPSLTQRIPTERLVEVKLKEKNFYPGPGLEPGPLALRASALPLRHPRQLPIQGRINLFEPILSDLRTTNSVVITSYRVTEGCRG